jgi:hypothetical protein
MLKVVCNEKLGGSIMMKKAKKITIFCLLFYIVSWFTRFRFHRSKNYGSYGCGSYGPVPVPVPQHCFKGFVFAKPLQGVLCLSAKQENIGVGSTCPTGAEPSTPRRAATGSSSSADTKTIQEVSYY